MRCKKCKTPLRKGSKFCPKCGVKVKHTGRKIVVGILLVVVLLPIVSVSLTYLGIVNIPLVSSFMDIIGLPSKNVINAEAALSNELDRVLNNEGGIHFVSDTGDPISSLQGGEIQRKIMSCISYTLQPESINANTAVIDAEFVYPDLISLAEKYITDGNSPDTFAEWINEHIEDEASYLNASTSFVMRKNGDNWEITMPSEIYDVLSGGMQSYMQEKNSAIYDSLKEGATS